MKKALALAIVVILCVAVAVPATAASIFVSSPVGGGGVGINTGSGQNVTLSEESGAAAMGEQEIASCVVITTVEQAEKKSTDISQEARDLLIDLYKKLSDGTMTLPVEGDYAIRDLVQFGFKNEACTLNPDHGNKAEVLKQEGVTLTASFTVGVAADDEVVVLVYIDGNWVVMEEVTNNGDGTITCVFEDIGPVAFVVKG